MAFILLGYVGDENNRPGEVRVHDSELVPAGRAKTWGDRSIYAPMVSVCQAGERWADCSPSDSGADEAAEPEMRKP